MCGSNDTVPWSSLQTLLSGLAICYKQWVYNFDERICQHDHVELERTIFDTLRSTFLINDLRLRISESELDMCSLLGAAEQRQCNDPRDMVYGLVDLVKWPQDLARMTVDYTRTPFEVARSAISHHPVQAPASVLRLANLLRKALYLDSKNYDKILQHGAFDRMVDESLDLSQHRLQIDINAVSATELRPTPSSDLTTALSFQNKWWDSVSYRASQSTEPASDTPLKQLPVKDKWLSYAIAERPHIGCSITDCLETNEDRHFFIAMLPCKAPQLKLLALLRIYHSSRN